MRARRTPPTESGSVLADEPAVIDEKRSQAHGKHGGREEEEEDVELCLSVWEAVLRREKHTHTHTLTELHRHKADTRIN